MKKNMLLPLLILVLTACGSTSSSSFNTGPRSSTPTSSPTSAPTSTLQTITSVRAKTSEGEVTVEGSVVAVNLRSFLLRDATGTLLVYLNALPTQSVGAFVRVTGTTTIYQGARQIGNTPAPVIVTGSGTNPNLTAGTPTQMTNAQWNAFDMATSIPTFIRGQARVFQSGNFYNFNYRGIGETLFSTMPGSLSTALTNLDFAIAANVGKTYQFEGFLIGTSVSSGANVRQNVLVTSQSLVEGETASSSVASSTTTSSSTTTPVIDTSSNPKVDIFGTIGFDPGTGWDTYTYGNLAAGVTATTVDRTLTRLPGFGPSVGNIETYVAFTPIEWGVTAMNSQTLGSHNYGDGADASDLFISEYIEGSSNNKALEIANFTGAPVDLSDYIVALYSNGRPITDASYIQTLTGTLEDGEVFVIYNGQMADAGMLSAINALPADQKFGSVFPNSVCTFNGDDALALLKKN